MLELAIQKGVIIKANTNDPAQKSRFYILSKVVRDFLKRFNVPFYDACCSNASTDLPSPVGYQSGLKYYNGSTWVAATPDYTYIPAVAQQNLSGNGAINVTSYFTAWTTTGINGATLANGTVVGQLKKVLLESFVGDGILTPVSLSGGTSITFTGYTQYVILNWNGTAWVVIENFGTSIA